MKEDHRSQNFVIFFKAKNSSQKLNHIYAAYSDELFRSAELQQKRYFNVIAELFLSINASVLVCYDKTLVEFAIQFQ